MAEDYSRGYFQKSDANTYNKMREDVPKPSKLKNALVASAIAASIGVGGYFLSKDKGIELDGAPKGYELSEFDIPTRGDVNYIKLGGDTLDMQISRNPEKGTITYEGPITYRISDSRPPTTEPDMIKKFSEDTRHGSLTLEKRIE